jgi:hypothetical protein
MAQLIAKISAVAIPALGAVCAYFWSLLAARVYVSYRTEQDLYLFSLVATVSATLSIHFFFSPASRGGIKRASVLVSSLVISSVLMILAWRESNALFFQWFVRTTTPAVRSKLITELISLAPSKSGPDPSYINFSRSSLPRYFSKTLGKPTDFYYGSYSAVEDSGVELMVVYGYKSRCWGLYKGPALKDRWPTARVYDLGDSTYFFQATQ